MDSKLTLSDISFVSSSIWGPDQHFILDEYKNLPFAPFNKLEKLGRFVDLTNPLNKPVPSGNVVATIALEEEDEFTMVEAHLSRKDKKKKIVPAPVVNKPVAQQSSSGPQYKNQLSKKQVANFQRYNYNRQQAIRTKFKDNAGVQTDWVYISDASKSNFDKTPVFSVKVEDLSVIGKIPAYDKTWDGKLAGKKATPFELPNTVVLGSSPRQDKFIQDQIKKDVDTEDIVIYTTDTILSSLLTVKSSVFPWDIFVYKDGNQLFFEPSEKNKASYVDILTVNENTSGNLPEDEKDMFKVCLESTNVNRKFIDITTRGTDEQTWGESSPYFNETPENKVYRYRKWTIDAKTHIVCRSEIDACIVQGENRQFTKVCALNEFDSQNDWKSNYETNRGALISAELRNNGSKISKWLCQALLADCEQFRLGFVTKPNPKDTKQQVLTVEAFTTKNLSDTVNFNLKSNWSIIKTIVEVLSKQEDGIYAFIKLPYKQSLRIYQIPSGEKEE